jgi:hypothetical protein
MNGKEGMVSKICRSFRDQFNIGSKKKKNKNPMNGEEFTSVDARRGKDLYPCSVHHLLGGGGEGGEGRRGRRVFSSQNDYYY